MERDRGVRVRPVEPGDAAAWERMRQAFWPSRPGEHAEEIARYFAGDRRNPAEALLAVEGEAILGFAELAIRPYAEGCVTPRVAYLEGWWVEPRARHRGVGRALVEAAIAWGREQGCTELASDTGLDNAASAAAHAALGFEETGRIICYRMAL